jgi:hypothetical protein
MLFGLVKPAAYAYFKVSTLQALSVAIVTKKSLHLDPGEILPQVRRAFARVRQEGFSASREEVYQLGKCSCIHPS